MKIEQINAYKISFKEYTKLNKEDLNKLYKEYVILGVYEHILSDNLLLIKKDE